MVPSSVVAQVRIPPAVLASVSAPSLVFELGEHLDNLLRKDGGWGVPVETGLEFIPERLELRDDLVDAGPGRVSVLEGQFGPGDIGGTPAEVGCARPTVEVGLMGGSGNRFAHRVTEEIERFGVRRIGDGFDAVRGLTVEGEDACSTR